MMPEEDSQDVLGVSRIKETSERVAQLKQQLEHNRRFFEYDWPHEE